jgi:hypothetical protein
MKKKTFSLPGKFCLYSVLVFMVSGFRSFGAITFETQALFSLKTAGRRTGSAGREVVCFPPITIDCISFAYVSHI